MSKVLQQNLVELGYGGLVGAIDGINGKKTKNAVKALQKDHDLLVDGIVGVKTNSEIFKLKKSAGIVGTKNFNIKEFASKDGSLPKNGMDSELLLNLELLRWKLGNKSIRITSGYRTREYNTEVGGIANSNHLTGKAADIKVAGVTPSKVHAEALHIFNGVGRYNTFTHVDVDSKRVHFAGKY